MHGLRIQKRRGARTQVDFRTCFRSILPTFDDHCWIVQQGAFLQFPLDWVDASTYDEPRGRHVDGPLGRFDALRLDAADGYESYGPGLLPEFAAGITEDWNELFAFLEPVSSLRDWVARRFGDERAEHVAATATACFLNVDAAYWEIHARDAGMIEVVRSDMESEPSVIVQEASLAGSHGL